MKVSSTFTNLFIFIVDESRLIVKKAAVPPAINNERRVDHDAEERYDIVHI